MSFTETHWASRTAGFREQFKELQSLHDLANFWDVSPSQISFHAFHSDKKTAYRVSNIPRRNGRARRIEQPSQPLKYIQRLIHESLTKMYGPHPAVHGFVANKSIVTNAQEHLGCRYVLNLDLSDFFPSITRKRIYGRLIAEPYSLDSNVANIISSLATNAFSQLPQGSPSSPVLANIVASEMDSELAELCGNLHCWYTRYADDITISTTRREMSPRIARYPSALGTGQAIIGDSLSGLIEKHGFAINHRKTRLQSYWTRQVCTGLVVNGNKVAIQRSYIRRLRSLIHHWKMNGWQDAIDVLRSKENRFSVDTRPKLMDHVKGRIAYMKMVRGQEDPISRRLSDIVASIPQNH